MLAEIGQFTLALGLVTAFLLSVIPLVGCINKNLSWQNSARPLAYLMLISLAASFLILVTLFVIQDFTVQYVWQHSNLILPIRYRISATWGAHEGSMLLWLLVQALWTAAVAWYSKSLNPNQSANVLSILGIITFGFAAFVFFMSNPFLRTFPAPMDGVDLNPLLQDIGLILHPPILYMGYVGLSVPFAISIAALLSGEINEKWIRWSRTWTNAAWAFLTLGIVLGSWWAYYELGWGGWWFWDPVENASFLPWLACTALIHVQAVSERRNSFRGWTVLLAIICFSLTILGTFLVRSGAITSVHAFASDPARGVFILALLAIYAGGALFIYSLRAHKIISKDSIELDSRETLLLANSIIFITVCFMVLLGTLFPMIFEAFDKKISVGEPYFSKMFFIMMIPMVLLLPFGIYSKWRKDSWPRLIKQLSPFLAIALVLTFLAWLYFKPLNLKAILGLFGSFWLLITILYYFKLHKGKFTRSFMGMQTAHIGVAIFIFGVTMTEHTDFEIDSLMNPGEVHSIKGYNIEFKGVVDKPIENYQSSLGHFVIRENNKIIATMNPEKRIYSRQSNPMTEAAIDPGFTRDLYISLGEQINDKGGWGVRIYIKPYIRWMWGGGLLMMLGGFIAATDKRYFRHAKKVQEKQIEQHLEKIS